ncbi:unannotated protein [freshwater metagenome]|uniref:Unannotated protein n=1 Tax=freshwater metagenome TaxID=449393 RepID=A0A6J7RR18_9ZZZZ
MMHNPTLAALFEREYQRTPLQWIPKGTDLSVLDESVTTPLDLQAHTARTLYLCGIEYSSVCNANHEKSASDGTNAGQMRDENRSPGHTRFGTPTFKIA